MAATEGAPRTYTDEEKQEALELYRQDGPAAASRKTGIKSATIRSWAHRNGEAGSEGAEQTRAATETARLGWAQRRAELTDETGAVAAAILDRIKVSKRSSDARALAQAFSVLIDRAQLLDGGRRLAWRSPTQRTWPLGFAVCAMTSPPAGWGKRARSEPRRAPPE